MLNTALADKKTVHGPGRYGNDCFISANPPEREFRSELALPVHEQSHQSDDAEWWSADPTRLDGTERYLSVRPHQHDHQLEYHRHDTPLPYAASPCGGHENFLLR